MANSGCFNRDCEMSWLMLQKRVILDTIVNYILTG